MPEAYQPMEVKRRVEEYVSTLPVDEKLRPVLMKGGGSIAEEVLDPDQAIIQ